MKIIAVNMKINCNPHVVNMFNLNARSDNTKIMGISFEYKKKDLSIHIQQLSEHKKNVEVIIIIKVHYIHTQHNFLTCFSL